MSADTAELDVLAPPENFATGALANSVFVPGNILVFGFYVYNTKASAQFLCVFDAQAVPADTAVPLFSKEIPAHSGVGFSYGDNGRRFKSGLVITNSSTDATKTIGSADCFFDVQYRPLYAMYEGAL